MTEERFDELLNEMRGESAPPEQVAAACDRVWREISGGGACAELRPELTAYLAGQLAEPRLLLMDDHLGRCADCRRALSELKGETQVIAMPKPRQSSLPKWTRWAIAAGVAIGALYLGRDNVDVALAPSGPRATVVSVSGALYRLPDQALQPGSALNERDVVRTTAGSHAILQLTDGSRVEVNERTELYVQAAWSGETVRLNRGDIFVQAAKQRRGRLRVVTNDSIAAVKGTMFAVSSGAAGSLISVVEGSVAVTQPGSQRLVTAGKQAASNSALEPVKFRQAVAWSKDAEKYYALVNELGKVEQQIFGSASAAPRTEARLLRYLPAGAIVYVAIPNLDGAIRQGLYLFEQRTRDNATLSEWWSSDAGQELKKTLDRLQAVTPLLGAEVIFVLAKGAKGPTPLVLAEIQPGREEALRQAIDRVLGEHQGHVPYKITQNLLMFSDGAVPLGGGASSPFAAEITQRYQHGVNWLAGVDASVLSSHLAPTGAPSVLGFENMRYLFFEQGSGGGRDENEATLTFQGARVGLASWLAAPGSSGSAEYISSEAVGAFAASTRDPRQALDELFASIGQTGFSAHISEFEAETGVKLDADIAASLGTDFSVAIERPSLPVPGWVAALEVVRPEALNEAVKRLVDAMNRHNGSENKLVVAEENVNGRSWYSVKTGMAGTSVYWTYDRGYMILSMDRALAARAISTRESGLSLVRSAAFQQRFPATSGMHHSGFLWVNTNGILAELAGLVENPALKNLMTSREPVLVVLDGETERIRAASRTRLTSLLLDMALSRGAGAKL
jgi:hypothetical protein